MNRPVSLERPEVLLERAADAVGLDVAELRGYSTTRLISERRTLAVYCLHTKAALSIPELAKLLRRDNSTIRACIIRGQAWEAEGKRAKDILFICSQIEGRAGGGLGAEVWADGSIVVNGLVAE